LGVKPLPEALTLARQLDLDLVEVAPMANPPVCRIMDYGKFRYEESQKAKESRKKTVHVSIKEVKFRPKIGKGDFDTKVRHMQDFLAEGHKVKVTLQFRGREMAHPELGSRILDAVLQQVGPGAKLETQARLEGRNMTMVLAPEKKVVPKKVNEPKADTDATEQPSAVPDAEPAVPSAADFPLTEAPVAEVPVAEAAVAPESDPETSSPVAAPTEAEPEPA
jgi:translation initiation factor IF-3